MRLKYLLFGLFTVANIINVSARIEDKSGGGSNGENGAGYGGNHMIAVMRAFDIDLMEDEDDLNMNEIGIDRTFFDELNYNMLLKSVPVQYKNRVGYGNSRKPFIQEIKILVK